MTIINLLQAKQFYNGNTQSKVVKYLHRNNSDTDFHSEKDFTYFLRLERKRSERSRRPFLLVLIELNRFSRKFDLQKITKDIINVLPSTTRDTDIKGWCKEKEAIGIIFTETLSEVQDFQETHHYTLNKVCENLSEYLGSARFEKLKISYQIFPEEMEVLFKDRQNNIDLYQDLISPTPAKRAKLIIKRMIDIVGSFFAIVILSPVFLLLAILIKMNSSGHVVFKQERVGFQGKQFMFLKFRSMFSDNNPARHKEFVQNLIQGGTAESARGNGSQQGNDYKINNDPRVTSIGRFLRKTSLDELPQFFNVLTGDMSLVGPRPPIPYECEAYDIWHRRRILGMKPGITGFWQVEGRSTTAFDDMVRMDIRYMREWSLLSDFKILIKTPLAVVTCKGAC